MILSYRYRIEPNKTQSALLSEMLADFCELYNAALEHRILGCRKGVSIGSHEQITSLPIIRRELPHIGRWSATAEQQIMRKLDKSFKSFFARCKRGEAPGFPRFKAKSAYHAADFRVGNGLVVIKKTQRLRFIGVPGEIKVRWHRSLPSKPSSAVLSRNGGKWYIVFYVDVCATNRASASSVGIDVGLDSLVAMSNGKTIARHNFTKNNAKKMRRLQRAVSRCGINSNVRRKRRANVAKLRSSIKNSRRDNLHKLSTSIISEFGRIAIEDLNVKGLARGMLAKHVNDAAWSTLAKMLAYKAEKAGCELVRVDPRGTSQTCPECGTIKAKTLKERMHRCPCGCTLDRDVAAAMVIHSRAFGSRPPGVGGGSPIEQVAA